MRATALPSPGSEDQLKDLAGRVFSQQLDRDKPLWEVWLVEGLEGDRFALLSKTHHALVDGVSGVDIMSVLFDTSPEPIAPPTAGDRWLPRPLPSRAQLLAEALLERATMPAEIARSVRAVFRGPRRILGAARDAAVGVGAMAWAGLNPAPPSPYNGRSARTGASPGCAPTCATSRRSRTRSAAPSTTSCWPPSRAPWGATCAAAATRPTGSS